MGRTFFFRVLAAIAEAEQQLDQDLAALQARELVLERARDPELEYIFKHALVQEVTYESILLQRRRDLHREVAAAIESLFASRLDDFYGLLAYHYTKAEDWQKAQEFLFKAADQAGGLAADEEALEHYEQALDAYTRAFGEKWDPFERAASNTRSATPSSVAASTGALASTSSRRSPFSATPSRRRAVLCAAPSSGSSCDRSGTVSFPGCCVALALQKPCAWARS